MELSNYLFIRNQLPSHVNLLAVSKGFQIKDILLVYDQGQRDFGESKFQEAYDKQIVLNDNKNINWHFIGRIQSNKIRKIVQNFNYIHSVDSYEKLSKISAISYEEKKNPSIMLQIKLREDPTKGGFEYKALFAQWEKIKQLKNITIKGLMTINPKGLSSSENIRLFQKCRNAADLLQLHDCSMGMSGDWKEAVKAGSTWVRIGSTIFGER